MPNLRTETLDEGICVLTFDRPDSSANIFDAATLAELDAEIDRLAKPETQAKGLILTSPRRPSSSPAPTCAACRR